MNKREKRSSRQSHVLAESPHDVDCSRKKRVLMRHRRQLRGERYKRAYRQESPHPVEESTPGGILVAQCCQVFRDRLSNAAKHERANMQLMTWNIRYSTGCDELDQHHRHLIALLNRVHENYIKQSSPQDLVVLFDALTEYTRYHFFVEETLMQNWHYPDFALHKMMHEQFVQRLREIQTNFINGNHQISGELLAFLRDWVLTHIQEVDVKFGIFLNTVENPQTTAQ